jgi:hypothetical protein
LVFLRLFQHLLPRALAWRTTVDTTLRRYVEGLSESAADAKAFIDLVLLDAFPSTTRELPAWEAQLALASTGDEATRRARLAAAWRAAGGQSPDYIQTVLHTAGLTTVFVHEWWSSGPPFVALDPREYTTQPLLGIYQCESTTPWECFDSGPGESLGAHCDDTLANEPGYVINLDLTRRAPPPVPDDPERWPYFLYFSGEVFPELAPIDAARVDELKELLLRICPAQQWLVLLIDPIEEIEAAGEGFGSGPMGTVELGV